MSLPAPTYDRTAIMRDAHKRYRDGKRLGLGWTFGRCLSTAWQAAKFDGMWLGLIGPGRNAS